MNVQEIQGDLLAQNVDAIVNPWNRNFIPWWLLIPQGVSGALRKKAGVAPFRELRQYGIIKVGAAVRTSAGRLGCEHIIHVAGLHAYWAASERSIRESTKNALVLAESLGVKRLAYPLIGAGTGGIGVERARNWMIDEFQKVNSSIDVLLVKYSKLANADGAGSKD